MCAAFADRGATLEQIRAFVAIIDAGGFSEASKNLHRTQSAVTQNLKKLESVIGCRLLDRKQGRGISLTTEGERFLPQAKDILTNVSNAITALQKPPLAGTIRLGIPDDFDVENIQNAVSCCLKMNPHLRLEIRSALSDQVCQMAKSNILDIALFRTVKPFPSTKELEVQRLGLEKLHWVGREPITFSNLKEVPLVLFPQGCAYRDSAFLALDRVGKPHRLSYSSSSSKNIRGAVLAGLGVGVFPASLLDESFTDLSESCGFPKLPEVHLVFAVRPGNTLYKHFAEYLLQSSNIR